MRNILFSFCVFLAFNKSANATPIPEYLSGEPLKSVKSWLAKNKSFRIANDSDCESQEELAEYRSGANGWPKNESFYPFFTLGDFNSDGKVDFAIVVINQAGKKFLLIFNSYASGVTKPAIFWEIEGYLFYGYPRPEPYRLIVGKFGTEGDILIPKSETYEYDLSEN